MEEKDPIRHASQHRIKWTVQRMETVRGQRSHGMQPP